MTNPVWSEKSNLPPLSGLQDERELRQSKTREHASPHLAAESLAALRLRPRFLTIGRIDVPSFVHRRKFTNSGGAIVVVQQAAQALPLLHHASASKMALWTGSS